MHSLSSYLSPETVVLLIAVSMTALYCNWLVTVAERQKAMNK